MHVGMCWMCVAACCVLGVRLSAANSPIWHQNTRVQAQFSLHSINFKHCRSSSNESERRAVVLRFVGIEEFMWCVQLFHQINRFGLGLTNELPKVTLHVAAVELTFVLVLLSSNLWYVRVVCDHPNRRH